MTGKTLTFSGRTDVWRRGILEISDRFLFGFGYEAPNITAMKLGFANLHNFILGTLYIGGSALLTLFSSLFYISYRNFTRNGKEELLIEKRQLSFSFSVLICTILSVFIYYTFESKREFLIVYLVMFILYYLRDLLNTTIYSLQKNI